jgi:hypothetical protein
VVEIPPVALNKFIAIALAEQYNFAVLLADGSPQFWRDFENIFNRSACIMPTSRSRRLKTNTAQLTPRFRFCHCDDNTAGSDVTFQSGQAGRYTCCLCQVTGPAVMLNVCRLPDGTARRVSQFRRYQQEWGCKLPFVCLRGHIVEMCNMYCRPQGVESLSSAMPIFSTREGVRLLDTSTYNTTSMDM